MGPGSAEAILTLCTLISNKDFNSYWNFHIAHEHQRVHPNDYQLAA